VKRHPSARSASSPRRGYLTTAALLSLYIIGLQLVYREFLAPNFQGEGLTYRSPDPIYYPIVALGLVLLGLALPSRIDRVSGFIQWAMFLTAALPAAIIPQYSLTLPQTTANQFAAVVGLSVLLIRVLTARNPFLAFRGIHIPAGYVELGIGAFTLFVNAYVILFVGLDIRFLTFADANDVALRQGFVDASSALPFMGYLIATQFNVLNPVLVFNGLQRGRVLPTAIGILSQGICYLSTGQKHTVLLMLIILVLHFGLRGRLWFNARTMLLTLIFVSIPSMVLDSWTSSLTLTSFVIRRFLVVPGMLAGAYVSVFDGRPKGMFRDVIGSSVGQDSAALTVGREFLHSSVASANANLFGHGYYSYGFTGIVIEAGFVVLMFWAADAATFGRMKISAACALFAGPTAALTNTSPFTTLLTHGFLVAILLGAIYSPGRSTVAPAPAVERRKDETLPDGRPSARPGRRRASQAVETT